ncbi:hypothetical protein GOBAR_DD09139 [Gossypium barbadense]|nr:hypothetical protein GOBAR_DD09139 [Gossypium barbadense]
MGEEDQEEAKEELMQCLKTLEGELGEKLYFGGQSVGVADVALHFELCFLVTRPLRNHRSKLKMGSLGKAIYTVGFWIRETGQALDRLGCRLQGNYFFQEQLSRHRTLMNVFDKSPLVDKDAFVAPSASVIGDVQVGRGSSIWYGCVLRGDVNSISVGSGTNIQDNSLVHVAKSNLSGKVLPTNIGNNVTVGHSAVLHGCTVEDEAFVGMGATLLDGVVVEKHAMVAAGALV